MRYFRNRTRLARITGDWELCETFHWQRHEWQANTPASAEVRWSGDWDEISADDAETFINSRTRQLTSAS